MDKRSTETYQTNPLASLTLEEIEELEEAEHQRLLRHLRRRERKLWKARNRMPMHGKHLLRNNRRQHRRRNEHTLEG